MDMGSPKKYEQKCINKFSRHTISTLGIMISFFLTLTIFSDIFISITFEIYRKISNLSNAQRGVIFLDLKKTDSILSRSLKPKAWLFKLLLSSFTVFPLLIRQRIAIRRGYKTETKMRTWILSAAKKGDILEISLYYMNNNFGEFLAWILFRLSLLISILSPIAPLITLIDRRCGPVISPKLLIFLQSFFVSTIFGYIEFTCKSRKDIGRKGVFDVSIIKKLFKRIPTNIARKLMASLLFFGTFGTLFDSIVISIMVIFKSVCDGGTAWSTLLSIPALFVIIFFESTSEFITNIMFAVSDHHLEKCLHVSENKTTEFLEGINSRNILIREQAFMETLIFLSDKEAIKKNKCLGDIIFLLKESLEGARNRINSLKDCYIEIDRTLREKPGSFKKNKISKERSIPKDLLSEYVKEESNTDLVDFGYIIPFLDSRKETRGIIGIYTDILKSIVTEDQRITKAVLLSIIKIIDLRGVVEFDSKALNELTASLEQVDLFYSDIKNLDRISKMLFGSPGIHDLDGLIKYGRKAFEAYPKMVTSKR
eukprot:GHVP01051361.1.p1 GENE.GHVP01051361.1~~GHVP01051361.1.p1  ORF type:complete len:539 (-),score=90.25 GHVP01051361.1:486-2102(-)